MNFLNELYQTFDDLVEDYGMYKLDIVGDCYIVVAGLIKEDQVGMLIDHHFFCHGGWVDQGESSSYDDR
jgi:hypothetical protein